VEIDIKHFLRKHGFRHKQDIDRGAQWTNGVATVVVLRNMHREPAELRALMERVRKSAREKDAMRAGDAALLVPKAGEVGRTPPSWPITPEEHRAEQVAAAKSASIDESAEPALPSVPLSPEIAGRLRRVVKKFSGDERRYVYGRIKALLESPRNASHEIVAALHAEGITRLPSGKALDTSFISGVKNNWKTNPKNRAKYAAILMPRTKQSPAVSLPVRPVVVAAPLPPSVPLALGSRSRSMPSWSMPM
jgi:hypothetical protein